MQSSRPSKGQPLAQKHVIRRVPRSLRSVCPFVHSSHFYLYPQISMLCNASQSPDTTKSARSPGVSTSPCNTHFLDPPQLTIPDCISIGCAVLGQPFVKRFALRYRTVACLSCLSVCNVDVLWTNDWVDQDETWYGGRPRSRPHCVRWGPSSPSAKGAQPPMPIIFGPCMSWPSGWMD